MVTMPARLVRKSHTLRYQSVFFAGGAGSPAQPQANGTVHSVDRAKPVSEGRPGPAIVARWARVVSPADAKSR
jgi:hypothetical protein